MIRFPPICAIVAGLCALLLVPDRSLAQTPLTLEEAVARATAAHPDARIAAISEREAAARVPQARAGLLPRVDVTETWQRGDQPVFVFGSLLNQRQFTAANFAIGALNRPDAVNNLRLAVSAEQSVWDGGATRARLQAARVGVELAAAGRHGVRQALAQAASHAYGAVLQAEASVATARAALEAADADLGRTRDRRDAGVVTDADVLAVEVHRATVDEARVRAALAVDLARAELNRVMGEPLDAVFTLAPVSDPRSDDLPPLAALEATALAQRPELRQARLRVDLASAQRAEARAAFLPQVFAQAGWEANGGTWGDRAGSWIVGGGVRVNVFRGFADRARLAELGEVARRREFEQARAETAVRLEVRAARARVESARLRYRLARTVVEQAGERQRIVRDRYEQGLSDVTTLLRAAEAAMQAQEQQIRARVDVLVETAALDRALGR